MLNSLQLTGRAFTHVRDVADPQCILHERAAQALLSMRTAARAAGIELTIVSSFRDFKRQASIWNAKFRGERKLLDRSGHVLQPTALDERALVDAILIWSALPGASRHHWGTDIDVMDGAAIPAGHPSQLLPHEFVPGGIFARLDDWLTQNMAIFDFFRPYSTDRGGVHPEPWHLSYAPESVPALQHLTLEVLSEAVAASNVDGRDHILANLPEIYARYVLAVDNP
jgi:LAS superfamily LD-carboxypeptidase LdcB